MAEILCVHGVAQQLKGEHTLAQDWLPALLDGLTRFGYRGKEPSVALAFYGDLFRKPGTMAGGAPLVESNEVNEPAELAVILSWWQEAARENPNVMPPDASTMVRTPFLLQRALNVLSSSPFFAGMSQPLINLFARQLIQYLQDCELRSAVRGRVTAQITEETRILIGHSLGSVVAYECLALSLNSPVQAFVSLGSPLGIRNTVFEKLEPSPSNGIGIWPRGLREWTNIADKGDIVAIEKNLSNRFGDKVRDLLVNNEARAHDVRSYLTAAETGEAIAAGLA